MFWTITFFHKQNVFNRIGSVSLTLFQITSIISSSSTSMKTIQEISSECVQLPKKLFSDYLFIISTFIKYIAC